MSREIIGNSYTYIVDESYGINRDGFIAIGTESIVYKGLKTKRGGGLQFSCVLKFKPKKQMVDGATAAALGKLLEGPTKKVSKLISEKIPGLKWLAGKGSYDASYRMVVTKLKKDLIENVSFKTIRNGVISNLTGDFAKNILSGFGLTDFIKVNVSSFLKDIFGNLPKTPSVPITQAAAG